jgi:hypothetical protein
VRNLPININFQGASSSGITQQGASSSSKPIKGRYLKLVAFKISRLHLEKSRLSGRQYQEFTAPKPKQHDMFYVSVRIQLN